MSKPEFYQVAAKAGLCPVFTHSVVSSPSINRQLLQPDVHRFVSCIARFPGLILLNAVLHLSLLVCLEKQLTESLPGHSGEKENHDLLVSSATGFASTTNLPT